MESIWDFITENFATLAGVIILVLEFVGRFNTKLKPITVLIIQILDLIVPDRAEPTPEGEKRRWLRGRAKDSEIDANIEIG